MIRVHNGWYECEEGHITAGDGTEKKKCEAEEYLIHYEKGKRKGSWSGVSKKTDKKCGKPIKAQGEIPPELNYFEVWDHAKMHGFLINQKFDAHFMIGLQQAFKQVKDMIEAKGK